MYKISERTSFDSKSLLDLVWRHKKTLVVTAFAAAVLSAVFSSPFFIKPKYKSFAILYPSNLITYGAETPVEQMLQLLESNDIRDHVIRKFNLAEHYDVKKDDPYFQTHIAEEYRSNVSITKTKYESVLIEVLDTDKYRAKEIVTEIVRLLDAKARELQRSKSKEVVVIVENQMKRNNEALDQVKKNISVLQNNYGLVDYRMQLKEYTKGYVKSITSSQERSAGLMQGSLDKLKEKGNDFVQLSSILYSHLQLAEELEKEYARAVRDTSKLLTYSNVISRPEVPEKKAYPVRWLIVLVSTISAMAVAFTVVVLLDSRRGF